MPLKPVMTSRLQDWVPAAASADAEVTKADDEDEFGAKDFRQVMNLRPGDVWNAFMQHGVYISQFIGSKI